MGVVVLVESEVMSIRRRVRKMCKLEFIFRVSLVNYIKYIKIGVCVYFIKGGFDVIMVLILFVGL